MTPLLILNDLHLGCTRASGTTLHTRKQLQDYLQQSFRDTINQYHQHDLLIAGDLFDSFSVDVSQVLECYFTLADWLKDGMGTLHLQLGNHDLSKNSEKTSSFAFLCALLTKLYPSQVRVYDKGLDTVADDVGLPAVYALPHCTNQDLFDIELGKALTVRPGYLVLHANCMNHFAEQADHSLNVNEQWIDQLVAHGHTLIHAHEHQARTLKGGRVICMGNNFPSSVADCLAHGDAQKDGRKYAHVLDGDGLHKIETWAAVGDYCEVDWQGLALTGLETTARFIRVTGKASTEEASQVISVISRYRQNSDALVITSSVKIEGIDGLDELSTLSADRLASVDVMAALCAELEPEEVVVVKRLLED